MDVVGASVTDEYGCCDVSLGWIVVSCYVCGAEAEVWCDWCGALYFVGRLHVVGPEGTGLGLSGD